MSVLIATRDRPAILGCTLRWLAQLDVSGFQWEVIVADNGSDDDVAQTLEDAKSFLPLTTVHVREAGKNRALNRALPLATGDLLVFTDDDVIPDRNWLFELVAAARRWPEQCVFGGRTRLAPPPGTPDWIFELPHYAVNFGCYSPLEQEGVTDVTPFGANFAIRAWTIEDRSFNEGVGPDGTPKYAMGSETELLRRILSEVGTAVYVPTAEIRHVVQPEQLELPGLCGRSFRMGRGLARLDPAPRVPYLLGAPRWLWRSCATAAVTCLLNAWPGGPRSLDARLRYHQLRGTLSEYREISRRRSKRVPHDP